MTEPAAPAPGPARRVPGKDATTAPEPAQETTPPPAAVPAVPDVKPKAKPARQKAPVKPVPVAVTEKAAPRDPVPEKAAGKKGAGMPSRKIVHGSASAMPVVAAVASGGTVTILADAGNTERVWVGTDPRVGIYPWYGASVSPGGSVPVSASPGQVVYSVSHTEPAAITITTA